MDENVSPEALLTGHRKLRGPIQVVPFQPAEAGASLEEDVEAGGGAWRRNQKVPVVESPRYGGGSPEPPERGGHDGDEATVARERQEIVRNTSYMPRHHKSEVNPFINLTMHLPWYHYLKMVLVGVTLLPFRILFTIANVFLMWCFATLILTGLSEEAREQPFSKWRLALKYPICWCLRFQCMLFGFWWISVKGECADKEEAPIIVSNHVSPFEPFYLVSKTQATPVQRVEDSRAPILGTIQKAMQIMFVDRANPASKKKCLHAIEERSDPASTFPRVLVFPEGTCTNQRALITFKHGPFIPGQNVQPVTVRYPRKDCHLDPSYPAVAPSLAALALRVSCQVWNVMEIEYLPVYVPTEEDRDNPTLFAQHVQEYMSRSLGVPATQHAFEDVALQFQAMKMNLNPEDAVVEWSRVRQSLDIDAGTAKEYLIVFFEMDQDRDGSLSLEEFCAPWKRKRDEEAEKQLEAATALAQQKQREAREEEEALAARAEKAALRTGGELGMGGMEGKGEMETGLEEGQGGNISAQGQGEVNEAEGKCEEEEEEEMALAAAAAAAAAGLPGLLREEEMERAYDIFCGGEELTFQRFLTGIGVLSGLTREGRTGLFKFVFSMLEGRSPRPLPRQELETFVRRLRPDLTEKATRKLLGKTAELGGGGDVTREGFLVFAEQNGSILSVYQAMLLNDILGVERDIAEFGVAAGEDFGGLAVDTTELERTLDELLAGNMVLCSPLKMAVLAAIATSQGVLGKLTMTKVGGFSSANEDPLEIIVAGKGKYMYAASATGISILELGDDLSPSQIGFYTGMVEFGEPTSVAYNAVRDEVAFSVKAFDPLTKGRVYVVPSADDWIKCNFCDDDIQILEAGYLPDMVTFTPDGRRILTANEGEPLDYTAPENDPVGSVSIFKRVWKTGTYNPACEVGFEHFNTEERTERLTGRGMRVGGMDFTTFAMDMEPEYIAVTENGNTAYVTLQENNAVAKIDIKGCQIKRIYPLGYKEWGGDLLFDASNEDGMINLASWPQVKGMYMPDSITTYKTNGQRYFITANEGDGREYGEEDTPEFFTDETRVADLAVELGLDATMAPYTEDALGRLKVTNAAPFDGNIDELYAFGGRSISIFDGKKGNLVWDSGDFIGRYTADPANGFSDIFNSEGDVDSFDSRSDDKGAEPEGLVMAEIDGSHYVFVGLERIGGWMCWDVTDATAPVFQSYVNSNEDDIAPESAAIIPADVSPSGYPLLVAANEVSNTLAVFELKIED
eukprot:g15450.t1